MKKVLFNLTEEQYERLERLAKRMGVSKSEALRRSLELYQLVKETKEEGGEIRRTDKEGKESIMEVIG